MYKSIKYLLLIFTFVVSEYSYSIEYKISSLDTEAIAGIDCWKYGRGFGINDHGQVFGVCLYEGKPSVYFIDQTKEEFKFINLKNQILSPIALNNLGQIIGTLYENTKDNSLFLWSEDLGLKKINILNSKYVRPIALNDCNQIIGEYKTNDDKFRPFLWNNGLVYDMGIGSEFVKQIESYGYNLTNIKLTSINNSGHVVGYITCGKYNEKQYKYIGTESFPFYWDGTIHIIPVPLPLNLYSLHEHQLTVKLNNNGFVLIVHPYDNTQSYIWDKENGLKNLSNFAGKAINDFNVVLGYHSIWLEDKVVTFSELLGIDDINNIASPYSDTFSVERINYGMEAVLEINNKGQILCMGYVWGVWYPYILDSND